LATPRLRPAIFRCKSRQIKRRYSASEKPLLTASWFQHHDNNRFLVNLTIRRRDRTSSRSIKLFTNSSRRIRVPFLARW